MVVWLCRILPEEIAEELGLKKRKPESWISGLYNELKKKHDDIHLVYLFSERLSGKVDNYKREQEDFLCYPETKTTYDDGLRKYFIDILQKYTPDCVHIFGTEEAHSLAMINAGLDTGYESKMIIHIQGMVSYIARHYTLGIPEKIVRSYTIYDFIRQRNISNSKKMMERQGQYEIEALSKVKHVMGRTDWDYACCKIINSNVVYHSCWEMLRPSFYEEKWDYNFCQKYSIFVAQGGYPVKGFHFMLEALSILVKKYPSVHLFITGQNPVIQNLKGRLLETSYSKYIRSLITKYSLKDYITFLGYLDEKSMRDRYLKSNVFVSCSSVENSSNSIGEAMILGMPIVSSDVGGVKSMLTHETEGLLYQADAPYMLAYSISRIFENVDESISYGLAARNRATKRYDQKKILSDTMRIYEELR